MAPRNAGLQIPWAAYYLPSWLVMLNVVLSKVRGGGVGGVGAGQLASFPREAGLHIPSATDYLSSRLAVLLNVAI